MTTLTINQLEALSDLDSLIAKDLDQRTPEWLMQRLGRFTSSEIHKLIGTAKDSFGKSIGLKTAAQTYVLEKVAEVLTGRSKVSLGGAAIEWGNEYEGEARRKFENLFNENVLPVGFYIYGDHAGGSPDGLMRDENGNTFVVEIKCPFNSINHISHCLINTGEELKAEAPEYYWQVVANMVFTNTNYGIFISYDPRVLGEKKLHTFSFALVEEDKKELLTQLEFAIAYKKSILETLK